MKRRSNLTVGANEDSLALEGVNFQLQQLVKNVVEYKHKDNIALFTHINSAYIASLLSSQQLEQLEKRFVAQKIKNIGMLDLVHQFLQVVDHSEEETLYLTIGLIDFFRGISESLNMNAQISFQDITSAVCNIMKEELENDEYSICTRQQPPPRKFTEGVKKNQDDLNSKKKMIDFESPQIFDNNSHKQIQRLQKGIFHTDSSSHNNNQIKQAIYAKEIKRIIALDSLDDKITIYDLEAIKTKVINVKGKEEDLNHNGIIIFAIAWSEKQQRLGAVFKNFSMSFWEAQSDFQFEKNFPVHEYCQDYQNNIWYLEKHGMWITTDSHFQIYCWDIMNEKTQFALSTPEITASIFKIVELPAFDLCAVGSLDKKVSIWSFKTLELLFWVEVSQVRIILCFESSNIFSKVGVHSLAFLNCFQTLITAGYENNISLYKIDAKYQDSTLLGKLRGHTSMINCVEVIEGTPMIISADSQGVIRLWDIRNQSCVQAYEFGSGASCLSNSGIKKTQINMIVQMYEEGIIGLIGSRLSLIPFDQKEDICKNRKVIEILIPLKVETNCEREEIVVCTKKQLRYYDINTGKCKFSFQGMLEDDSEEISAFKQLEQGQYFLLGNSKGQLSVHSKTQNGERLKYLHGHSREITQIKVDYINKLIISSSWDSSIKIQRISSNISKDQPELKRQIDNVCLHKGEILLEASPYHNLMFTAQASEKKVSIFDYEYSRLLNYFEFSKEEPTGLCVMQGYPILFVVTSIGLLYCIHFTKQENTALLELLWIIPLVKQQASYIEFAKQISEQFKKTGTFLTKVDESKLVHRGQRNTLTGESPIFSHSPTSKLLKNQFFNKSPRHAVNLEKLDNSSDDEDSKPKEDISIFKKILPDFVFSPNQVLIRSYIYFASMKGQIVQINLKSNGQKYLFILTNFLFFSSDMFDHHSQLEFVDHANTRLNYNPFRNCKEDNQQAIAKFSGIPGKFTPFSKITTSFSPLKSELDGQKLIELSQEMKLKEIQAHQDNITSLIFVAGDLNHIITCGNDEYIRIWQKESLEQVCSLNINHPLPIQWNYKKDEYVKSQKKILFALRILDILNKKYDKEMITNQDNSTKILLFLKKLMGISQKVPSKLIEKKVQKKQPLPQSNEVPQKPSEVRIMSDYYSARDIKFEEVKHLYKKELQGPSLKTMEITKRVAIAQSLWKKDTSIVNQTDAKHSETRQMILNKYGKLDDKDVVINFLEPSYRNSVLNNFSRYYEEKSEFTQILNHKLDEQAKKKELMQILAQEKKMPIGKSRNSRLSLKSETSQHDHRSGSILETIPDELSSARNQKRHKYLHSRKANHNSNSLASQGTLATLILPLEIIHNGEKPHVKEPENFEKILVQNIPSSPQRFISIPDFEDTRIRVEAFPHTAAKIKSMGGNHYATYTSNDVIPSSNPPDPKLNTLNDLNPPNLYYDTGRSPDVYEYAKERQIIAAKNNMSSSITRVDTVMSQLSSASIQSASASKLHGVLQGLNSKLNKSKRFHYSSLHLQSQDLYSNNNNNQYDGSKTPRSVGLKTQFSSIEQKTQGSTFSNNKINEMVYSPLPTISKIKLNHVPSPTASSQISTSRTATNLFFTQRNSSRNLSQTKVAPFFSSSKMTNKLNTLTQNGGLQGKAGNEKNSNSIEYFQKNRQSAPSLHFGFQTEINFDNQQVKR